MSTSSLRRALAALVAGGALMVASFAVASPANASTLYACVKKNGTARVFNKKPKCKKGESKVSWGSAGPAGKNGANGSNGASGAAGGAGAPGQPQKLTRFTATIPTGGTATLYSADGITYKLNCAFIFIFDLGSLSASGAAGQSYGSAVYGRPNGAETKESDLKSSELVETLGAEEKAIATDTNTAENKEKSILQDAIWTISVEGPTTVTWFHVWMQTGSTCSIHGSALTVAG